MNKLTYHIKYSRSIRQGYQNLQKDNIKKFK